MTLADEITDFVREYFESPDALLTEESDLVAIFGAHDPDSFSEFLEDVGKRFNIRHRDLRDMEPGADARAPGAIRFARDLFFQKLDMEVVCVDRLTVSDLQEIVRAGIWPQHFIKPSSHVWPRAGA